MIALPNRRWLRFSLRTMFVLMTLVALWLGWELNIVRTRRAALAELGNDPAVLVFMAAQFDLLHSQPSDTVYISELRALLGDEPVALIRFDSGYRKSEIARARKLFPEADVTERDPAIPVDDSMGRAIPIPDQPAPTTMER